MSVEYPSFGNDVDTSEMPINVQKKGWEDILRRQWIENVNADLDEIDISSDDSDLEDNDNIEAIEEENPQISSGTALQMLDQLQDFASSFADTEVQWQLVTTTVTLQDVRLQCREQASIKSFFSTEKSFNVVYIYDLYIYILKNVSPILYILFCLYYWWIIVKIPINQKIMP